MGPGPLPGGLLPGNPFTEDFCRAGLLPGGFSPGGILPGGILPGLPEMEELSSKHFYIKFSRYVKLEFSGEE